MKNFLSAKHVMPLALAGFLSLHAGTGAAATIDDKGAIEVKKQAEDVLVFPLALQKVTGTGLVLGGPIEVSPKGDHYEVRVPGVSYSQPQVGLRADLGDVILNITPGDQGEYKVGFAVPSTVPIIDQEKKPVAEVTIGKQHFTGTWWPKYHTFTQVDADFGDLKITSKKEDQNFTALIGEASMKLDLTPSGDLWSGPSDFSLSQIRVDAGVKGELALSIDGITGKAKYDKMNLAVYRDLEQKTTQVLVDAQNSKQPDAAQSQALAAALSTGLANYINGMGTDVKISNFALTVTPPAADKGAGAKAEKPFSLRMAALSTSYAMNGLQEDKGSLSFQLGMEGLSVQQADESMAGIVPTASNIEVHLENLPMQALSKQLSGLFTQIVGQALAAQGAADPTQRSALQAQQQAQMLAAMSVIPGQLAAAGAKLSIVNTYAKAPDVGSTLDGAFMANLASPIIAQGNITLIITGLDEFLLKLQALAQAPGADPQLGGWYQNLGMLQLYGDVGKAADGRSKHTYRIDITPEGKVLLNNKDLGASMPGLGGGVPGGGAPGGGEDAPKQAPAPKPTP